MGRKWAGQALRPSWSGAQPAHSEQQHFVLPLCPQAVGEHQKQSALISFGSKKPLQANVIDKFSCSFISHPCPPALSLADGLILEGKLKKKNKKTHVLALLFPQPLLWGAVCHRVTVPSPETQPEALRRPHYRKVVRRPRVRAAPQSGREQRTSASRCIMDAQLTFLLAHPRDAKCRRLTLLCASA